MMTAEEVQKLWPGLVTGIEADVTATRIGEQKFMVVTGHPAALLG